MKNKIVSLDVEALSLRGRAFAIGIAAQLDKGDPILKVWATDENIWEACDYVKENVIPAINHLFTYKTEDDMLISFGIWYYETFFDFDLDKDSYETDRDYLYGIVWSSKSKKEDMTIIYHIGDPVESNLFQTMYNRGFLAEFDGPYAPVEVSTLLRSKGHNPYSVEEYLKEKGVELEYKGSTHDPIYDALATLEAYKLLSQ